MIKKKSKKINIYENSVKKVEERLLVISKKIGLTSEIKLESACASQRVTLYKKFINELQDLLTKK